MTKLWHFGVSRWGQSRMQRSSHPTLFPSAHTSLGPRHGLGFRGARITTSEARMLLSTSFGRRFRCCNFGLISIISPFHYLPSAPPPAVKTLLLKELLWVERHCFDPF